MCIWTVPSVGFAVTSGMTLISCPAFGRTFNSKDHKLLSFQFECIVKGEGKSAILNMCAMRITGNVGDRFIQAAVLLHMLDPVRGEPTAHGLDQDPHEIETPRERLLKRKFLDSFALLCAIKKDDDSVSAACME